MVSILLRMSRRLGRVVISVFSVRLLAMGGGTVVHVKLLGAIRTVKIMALAGNGKHGNGHKKQGE